MDYEGVIPRFNRLYLNRDISKLRKGLQEEIRSHVHQGPCPACGGAGLNPRALVSRVNGYNIVDLTGMPVHDLAPLLREVDDPCGASLATQVTAYLECMVDVGIDYLSLARRTDTLSGGEVQRVKLSSELHKQGGVYILDEPSTGLHADDLAELLALLRQLVEGGNTVVVVEHRLEFIAQADWVIDMGPGGGSQGGRVLFCGTPGDLMSCPESATGAYLRAAAYTDTVLDNPAIRLHSTGDLLGARGCDSVAWCRAA